MQLKMLKFILVSAKHKKVFQQQLGHRRSVAVIGSIINIEKKNISVKAVEHQQTVNMKKLGKPSIWFSEELSVISSILATEDTLGDTLT